MKIRTVEELQQYMQAAFAKIDWSEFENPKALAVYRNDDVPLGTAQERAEAFIFRELQNGPQFVTALNESRKWERGNDGFGENAFNDAAAHLRKRGVLVMSKNSRHQSIWTIQPTSGGHHE